MTGRGAGRGRGGGGFRGDRGNRGDRGGSPYRGDRGGGSWRGDPGPSSFRGGRGESPSRGDRGGGRGDSRGRGRGGSPQPLEAYGSEQPVPPPDPHTRNTENAVQSSLQTPPGGQLVDLDTDMEALKLTTRTAERPGYGSKGTAVTVWANHFRMTTMGCPRLYRYHIKVTPEAPGRKKRRVLELLLTEGHISRLLPAVATDYQMLLYTKEELTENDLSERIVYRYDLEDTPHDNARSYDVTLQQTAVLNLTALTDYIISRDGRSTLPQLGDCIQALNIIVGFHAKSQPDSSIMSLGSNRHFSFQGDAAESFDLLGGLKAWRGYFTSVRNGASRMTLNLQIKHTPVYEAVSLPLLMKKFLEANGTNAPRLSKFLKRVRVRTNHLPEKKNKRGDVIPRIKTIIGLAAPHDGSEKEEAIRPSVAYYGATASEVEFSVLQSSPAQQSSSGGGAGSSQAAGPQAMRRYTVAAYFSEKYNKQVDPRFPVVNVGTRADPVYLPADVCYVLPGQPAGAKLSSEQTRRMINFAVRKPHLNARSIVEKGTAVVSINPINPTLAQFGIAFDTNMITVPARILEGPNVLYKDNTLAETRFGSWNMNRIKFSTGSQAPNWSYVVVTRGTPANPQDEELMSAVAHFQEELNRIGVSLPVPLGAPGFGLDLSTMSIDEGFRRACSVERRPHIILFILPFNDKDIYNTIKYQGDIKWGIHTVCVQRSNLTKRRGASFDTQYCANVALKFNLKLGGVNQKLDRLKLGIVGEGKTMLVGVDVTHPSPGSSRHASSVSGMVASIDGHCTQFPAVLKIQEAREEIVSELTDMLKSRLRLWRKCNHNALPENILVYRDGISEGQFDRVIEQEVPALKEACRELYPATVTARGVPKLTVIICGKRHNTRFYPSTTQSGKIDVRSGNNPNGTVVDRGVTDPRCWDFYLQAHTAIQGTARPAHYYVIHDEIFTTQKLSRGDIEEGCQHSHDVVENLTHNLSYLYGRATKAVSICPPAYYADLLCERARCYLSDFFEPDSEADPGSAEPSASSEAGGNPGNERVLIHENLRDSMFYI